MILTVIGADNPIKGHFRPNLFAMKPNITLPKNTPIDQIEIIHDASSDEITNDNGVLSLSFSNNSFGLAHPPIL